MKENTYQISVDTHHLKRAKAVHLRGLSHAVGGAKITSDGKRVKILAKNKKERERLKVALQVTCRSIDRWKHYFRLSNKQELAKKIKEKPITARNNNELKRWFGKFYSLNDIVLLFIHRASDFVNVYSETSIINALFALESQVNITYTKVQKSKPSLPRPDELDTQHKVCKLENKIKRSGYSIWKLLALIRLRNKLAHSEWGEILTAKVQSCPDKGRRSEKLLIKKLGLTRKHFKISAEGQLRLTHKSSRLILTDVIDAIIVLNNISP